MSEILLTVADGIRSTIGAPGFIVALALGTLIILLSYVYIYIYVYVRWLLVEILPCRASVDLTGIAGISSGLRSLSWHEKGKPL